MIRFALLTALVALLIAACDDDSSRPGTDVSFENGVASGDVTEESVVLWTRAADGDELTVEVATNPEFDGATEYDAQTSKERDFTVKVHAGGLEPDTQYYYRFRAGGAMSAIGTFVTAPEASTPKALRFVFSGDSDGARSDDGTPHYNEFEVLDAAAAEEPAFFLYFGDTIYADRDPSAEDLDGFRRKYRENRGYEALRNILSAASTYNTWDDHEVYNDFAGEDVDDELLAQARQAFREYMPIDDGGDEDVLYRTFRWGADLDMIVLDERSYRSSPAVGACWNDDAEQPDPFPASGFDDAPDEFRGMREFVGLPEELPEYCQDEIEDRERTMLGDEQKAYLFDWLSNTDATWKVIVNPVAIQALLFAPYDRWEGYAAERRELLSFIRDEGIDNVVFLTTDFHANIFGPVRIEALDDSEPIAYEAIAGPIATNSFKGDIVEVVGDAAAGAVDVFLRELLNVDCVELDEYSYALVELDSQTMRIAAKDDTGSELCSVELEAR